MFFFLFEIAGDYNLAKWTDNSNNAFGFGKLFQFYLFVCSTSVYLWYLIGNENCLVLSFKQKRKKFFSNNTINFYHKPKSRKMKKKKKKENVNQDRN